MYHGDMFNFSASTLAFGDSLYFVTEQENKAKQTVFLLTNQIIIYDKEAS